MKDNVLEDIFQSIYDAKEMKRAERDQLTALDKRLKEAGDNIHKGAASRKRNNSAPVIPSQSNVPGSGVESPNNPPQMSYNSPSSCRNSCS